MKIIKKETLFESNYTNYARTTFENKEKQLKSWEFIERKSGTRAVIINAHNEDKVVLVKQFRIPLDMFTIEFSAGLIDEGESPKAAAIRELREETGYFGKVKSVSQPVCTSAGITDEIVYLVDIDIDSTPNNQELDPSEEIEVLVFDKKEVSSALKKHTEEHKDTIIDSKVWAVLCQ